MPPATGFADAPPPIYFGRVYLGVHRPTEVLAGMLVGTFAIAAGYAAWPKNRAGTTNQ